MAYFVSFRHGCKGSDDDTLQNKGFFDQIASASTEEELQRLLSLGQAHNQKLGLSDRLELQNNPETRHRAKL